MAIRIREINGKWVALCAAEAEVQRGDIYLHDAIDHALRVKFIEDYRKEGLIEQAEPSEAEEFVEEAIERMERLHKSGFLQSSVKDLIEELISHIKKRQT